MSAKYIIYSHSLRRAHKKLSSSISRITRIYYHVLLSDREQHKLLNKLVDELNDPDLVNKINNLIDKYYIWMCEFYPLIPDYLLYPTHLINCFYICICPELKLGLTRDQLITNKVNFELDIEDAYCYGLSLMDVSVLLYRVSTKILVCVNSRKLSAHRFIKLISIYLVLSNKFNLTSLF